MPTAGGEMSLLPEQNRAAMMEKGMLPELRSSMQMDKTKPLPTSLQSDFIPEDILFALTQPPASKDKLGPPSRTRNLNVSHGAARAPPANVWNHRRKDRFKHLMENTPCACGAGKDISFLYDIPQTMTHAEKPDRLDKSAMRKGDAFTPRKPLQLPDTLIPEEYHVVKNKGVLGIEYHEDKYSTNPEDHEKHLVSFPSMKPASRSEVIALKNSLASMLDKVGHNDLDSARDNAPTQMHNLLDLIKKEQNIYNVVFHELIRQTSIECVERGELLAELRNKYSELLNKVPDQIMSLHEEVMAQRALDRRLTDELMRFKGTIGVLTSELTAVKEHDKKVTKEAMTAQQDLRSALGESQKNASLLAEYHDLYELQRRRLERSVFMLSEEREIWSTAAYSLALKVTEEYRLNTAKRLQLCEKGWVKMANHFTILLSDRDTDLLTKIQGYVENWRDLIEDFNIALKHREEEMRENLKGVKGSIGEMLAKFKDNFLDAEGNITKKPDEEFVRGLLAAIKTWDEAIIKETDVFGGDSLLGNQEELANIRREMEGWTDNALKVFSRHRGNSSKTHADQVAMMALNEEVDSLITQFHNRITGENGVAALVIHLQSALEAWETRLIALLQGTMTLQESDWGGLASTMDEWVAMLDQSVTYVGGTQREDDRQEGRGHTRDQKKTPSTKKTIMEIHAVVRKTQKWATTASNSIDSEDAKLVEQVSSSHSEMIRWMVQVLLRLAPDKEGNSKESNEMALLGSSSIPVLTETAKTLFESLETFSNYVTLCCHGIVVENTQKRQENNEENADHELRDLKRLRSECDEWVQTAQILMTQLTGESVEALFPARASTTLSKKPVTPGADRMALNDMEKLDSTGQDDESVLEEAKEESPTETDGASTVTDAAMGDTYPMDGEGAQEAASKHEDESEAQPATEVDAPPPPVKEMTPEPPKEDKIEVLGTDSNTHKHVIDSSKALGSLPVNPSVEGSPDTKKAFEALAAVQTLQTQLIQAENRAQEAEEKVSEGEQSIVSLEERVRALEKMLEDQADKLERGITTTTTAGPTPVAPSALPSVTPANVESPRPQSEDRGDKSGRKSGRSSGRSSSKKK